MVPDVFVRVAQLPAKKWGLFTNEVLFAVAEGKDEALELLSGYGIGEGEIATLNQQLEDGQRAEIGFTHPHFQIVA